LRIADLNGACGGGSRSLYPWHWEFSFAGGHEKCACNFAGDFSFFTERAQSWGMGLRSAGPIINHSWLR